MSMDRKVIVLFGQSFLLIGFLSLLGILMAFLDAARFGAPTLDTWLTALALLVIVAVHILLYVGVMRLAPRARVWAMTMFLIYASAIFLGVCFFALFFWEQPYQPTLTDILGMFFRLLLLASPLLAFLLYGVYLFGFNKDVKVLFEKRMT
jgi:hypothetical protein